MRNAPLDICYSDLRVLFFEYKGQDKKGEITMVNFKEDEQLSTLNHSCAHLMAQAIKHLYPTG